VSGSQRVAARPTVPRGGYAAPAGPRLLPRVAAGRLMRPLQARRPGLRGFH
jgi:hypothetical protein